MSLLRSRSLSFRGLLWFGASICLLLSPGRAQTAQRLVTAVPDNARAVTLKGNTHPATAVAEDLGEVAPEQPMQRMMLVLGRSEAQEKALEGLLAAQLEAGSGQFHQWLTPEEFGERFGPAEDDTTALTAWLQQQGFHDVHLNHARDVVEFSGTAGAVEQAFHTAIHQYRLNGKVYSANASDPAIPEALAPLVRGVVSLHNFPRQKHSKVAGVFVRDKATGQVRPATAEERGTGAAPEVTLHYQGYTYYPVGPYDFATIYNLLPLWTAATPVDGTGQQVAIVGETDINSADFVAFRKLFGLPLGNTNTPTGTQYLNIIQNGPDPGVTYVDEETEADLDTQWSSATAKGATIDFVTSASTETTAGIDLSAEYIVDNNVAPVMSTSYGLCEHALGTAGNAFYNTLYQQAAAEGITVMTSSGDSGSAGCDYNGSEYSVWGLNVSGMTSTPYNVSVGGTDFYVTNNASTYWNSTSDPVTGVSAKGYIPELVWNDGCGNTALANTSTFSGMTPLQVCNDSRAWNQYLTTVSGSGGKSMCTQSAGTPSSACSAPYAKPTWQAGPGVPNDGVRDVPDLSLFAGNGEFGSFYVVCQRDAAGICSLSSLNSFVGVGGTSGSSPAFAGIMAMVNQQTGSRQGNANYMLYKLAAAQSQGGCNSATGSGSGCVFNDITTGSNIVPCQVGRPDCSTAAGLTTYGVLNGYPTTAGYDLASGLGSVNVANLVRAWTTATGAATTTTTLSLGSLSFVHGTAVPANIAVTAATGTPTGQVALNGNTPNGSMLAGSLTNGAFAQSINGLPGGSYAVTAHYAGDGTFAASDSAAVTVNVSPETGVVKLGVKTYDYETGVATTVSSAPYGSVYILRSDVGGTSGVGLATGAITLRDNGTLLDGGTFALNSESMTEDVTTGLLGGSHSLTSNYKGDASFTAATDTKPLTVTPLPMQCNRFFNTNVLRPGWNLTFPIVYSVPVPTHPSDGGYIAWGDMVPPTGTFSVYEGSTKVAGPFASTSATGGAPPVCGPFFCNLTTPTINGTATVSAAQIQQPLQPFTVVYSGDSNYASCTSPAVTETWQTGPIASAVNATATVYQYTVPQGTTLTYNLSVAAASPAPQYEPAYPVATGTAQAYIDGAATGPVMTLDANGKAAAMVPTTGLAVGSHTLSFRYPGDANYAASTSNIYTFVIVGPDFSLTPNYLNATVTNGSTTAGNVLTVTPSLGFAGTVNFSCSNLPRGASCVFTPASVAASGSTTVTVVTTRAAVVRAQQGESVQPGRQSRGRGLFPALASLLLLLPLAGRRKRLPSVMAVVMLLVIPVLTSCGSSSNTAPPTPPVYTNLYLSASTTAPTENSNVNIQAMLTGSNGTALPSGTISFITDGVTTTPTTVAVNSGTTNWQTSFATPGTHTVMARYSGDAKFQSSASNPLTFNVQYASGTPPGYYSITVTGSSGSLSHTVPLTLVVQ